VNKPKLHSQILDDVVYKLELLMPTPTAQGVQEIINFIRQSKALNKYITTGELQRDLVRDFRKLLEELE
tara:strand:+ start:347 stop:553 length:207 start_codon:yes stop_codon:yes gene_type:complete